MVDPGVAQHVPELQQRPLLQYPEVHSVELEHMPPFPVLALHWWLIEQICPVKQPVETPGVGQQVPEPQQYPLLQ
jgi:hypothetical protein